MITDRQKLEVKHVVDQTVANFIDSLPSKINDMLNKSIAQVMGLKYSGWHGAGGFEVDHCNGNKSYLSEMVKRTITEECVSQLKQVVDDFVPRLVECKRMRKALYKEAEQLYRSELRSYLITRAKERAARDAEAILNGLDFNGVVMGPKNHELEDPESFDGPLGRHVLEQRIRDLGLVDTADDEEEVKARILSS